MTATYEPIATTTLGSNAASYTFSSIPSTYTDLVLVASIKGTTNDQIVRVRFNSDTGSNYSTTSLIGTGSSAVSQRQTTQTSIRIAHLNSNSNFDPHIVSINNYANTTTYKSTLARENSVTVGVSATVGLWRSTSAVTSIEIFRENSNMVTGSTLTLYGIKAK